MPTVGRRSDAAERVARVCAGHSDTRSLRAAVRDEIDRVVPFDAYAWLVTDPESEVGGAPLADVPCAPQLPALIRWKYLTEVNRWTAMTAPVARLVDATGGHLERSLVWHEMQAGLGVTDVMSAVFRDRFGCWGFLDLWRIGGDPFSEDEAAYLASIVAPVTEALRRTLAATFDGAPLPAERGPAVLVLSPDLTVRAQTAETDAYLRAILPTDGDRAPVPAAAYNVAAQLLANEAGVDAHPPWARVHLPGGPWLMFRAARMDGMAASGDADIAVTIEACSPAERLGIFARAFGLTKREAELLEHLAAGADSREVAEAMFVSRHTVQDHLKSIFAKTGSTSRRALLARVAGT